MRPESRDVVNAPQQNRRMKGRRAYLKFFMNRFARTKEEGEVMTMPNVWE